MVLSTAPDAVAVALEVRRERLSQVGIFATDLSDVEQTHMLPSNVRICGRKSKAGFRRAAINPLEDWGRRQVVTMAIKTMTENRPSITPCE